MVENGALGLDDANVQSAVQALRAIEALETTLVQIRRMLVQRTILFGKCLPRAARAFEKALDRDANRSAC